jgi:hypothetical protein
MSGPYVVQPAPGTSCPHCRAVPRLLIRDDGACGYPQSPAFYICACGFIGQIGVGPVLGSVPTPLPAEIVPRIDAPTQFTNESDKDYIQRLMREIHRLRWMLPAVE